LRLHPEDLRVSLMSLVSQQSSGLKKFFLNLVNKCLFDLAAHDQTVVDYIAQVLTDFAREENLFRIRNARGHRIESVVEMLAQSRPDLLAENMPIWEREVRKYIGDYALFMSGIFRDYVAHEGFLDYYLAEGGDSYQRVARLELDLLRSDSRLFEQLARRFVYYSGALDYLRKTHFDALSERDPFKDFPNQISHWMKGFRSTDS
jgi:hypothetical protein